MEVIKVNQIMEISNKEVNNKHKKEVIQKVNNNQVVQENNLQILVMLLLGHQALQEDQALLEDQALQEDQGLHHQKVKLLDLIIIFQEMLILEVIILLEQEAEVISMEMIYNLVVYKDHHNNKLEDKIQVEIGNQIMGLMNKIQLLELLIIQVVNNLLLINLVVLVDKVEVVD